jgi:hypothetical protein
LPKGGELLGRHWKREERAEKHAPCVPCAAAKVLAERVVVFHGVEYSWRVLAGVLERIGRRDVTRTALEAEPL